MQKSKKSLLVRAGRMILLGIVFAVFAHVGPLTSLVVFPAHAATSIQCGPYPGVCSIELPDVGGGIPVYMTNQDPTASIKQRIDFQLTYALYLGVLNAATLSAQQIAYDSAVWVANGGKAQGTMFEGKNFGQYLAQTTLDSAGEFIGTFSEEFTKGTFGLDLCAPPRLPELMLEFQLSIPDFAINGIPRPKPKCNWTEVVNNWEASVESLSNVESLQNIRGSFTQGGNDLSFAIGSNVELFNFMAQQRDANILDRLERGGYKNVTNAITGNIETPAAIVESSIDKQLIDQPADAQNRQWGSVMQNAFELGWVQLGVVTASTFANTLVSQLMGKVFKGLFDPGGGSGLAIPDLLNPGAAPPGAVAPEEIASVQFRDIIAPQITTTEQQDILSELIGCPDEGRTKWNCAMAQEFALVLRKGNVTVRQAIDQGFINEAWQLIPSTMVKDNVDTTCKDRAFCISNLRKMRLARLIPIGWELAADSSDNQARCSSGSGCVTLGEVIQHFDDCNNEGKLDREHPYCHLIDPNWVLTAFPAQCVTKGFGNSLLTGSSQRVQECQDTMTCLERDPNGTCSGGYGYCLAEQTFWQFDAVKCDEQYVSCRSYTPRGSSAKPIGYLRSTLDYGSCNETNVGCMWYARVRDASVTSTIAWTAAYDIPNRNSSSYRLADRVYFDKNAATCESQYDGCTTLREVRQNEHALNLIQNSSFEEVGADGNLSFWYRTAANTPVPAQEPRPATGESAFHGSRSVLSPLLSESTASVHQIVRVKGLRQYTFSYYTRRFADTPSSESGIMLYALKANANPFEIPSRDDALANMSGYFASQTCIPQTANGTEQRRIDPPSTLGDEWQRIQCSFVTPPDAAYLIVYLRRTSGNQAMLDALMLEEGEVATPYSEGLNASLATLHMKVAPSELSCTGNAATDHPNCSSYAMSCKQNEAGCQGYQELNQAGTPVVPAVLTAADYCPAECVGYSEFRKQPSTFDLVRNPDVALLNDPEDDTIASFIPKTASLCTAQAVGCEAFTNLDSDTLGGEQAVAFNYLRSCEKPNTDTQTFYTWEGSDTSGYQLVTWSLQLDTLAPSPQPPKILVKSGPDGRIKNPASCNSISYLSAVDPDCRQFYDPQGNVFYLFESQTVLADASCAQFRKDDSSRADCENTGGSFVENTNQCIYLALQEQSSMCDINVAGCRAYTGTQGGVRVDAYSQDFREEEHGFSALSGTVLSLSDESVLVGDTSLRLQKGSAVGGVTFDVPTVPGMTYEFSFWAKSLHSQPDSVTLSVIDPSVGEASAVQIGDVTLTPQWNIYRIGPFSGVASTGAGTTRIQISGIDGQLSFIDTVRVTQVTDVAYVVKNSWNTPAVCDRTTEGIPQIGAMIGCREYVDRNQTVVPVRQFTRLCRETAIGCKAFIHTENTASSYERTWERSSVNGATEVTVRLPDHYEYYIQETSKRCPESQASCRAFGLPKFHASRLGLDYTNPFETVYLLDSEAMYEEGLCAEEELFCEEYKYAAAGQAGVDYFRAPGEHACEWKEGAVVAVLDANGAAVPADPTCALPHPERYVNATYNGWFKVGTECPCYPEILRQGSAFGIRNTGDAGFNVWGGASSSLYSQTISRDTGYLTNVSVECATGNCPNVSTLRILKGKELNEYIGKPCTVSNGAMQTITTLTDATGFTFRIRGICSPSVYQAWTALCPNGQSECTEFRDVNDKSEPMHPLGRPYFIIADERLDRETCAGKVDTANGCVLFRDMSNSSLTYNTLASFDDYKRRGYSATGAVNCETQTTHPSCQVNDGKIGFCTDFEYECSGAPCTREQALSRDTNGNVIQMLYDINQIKCATDNDCSLDTTSASGAYTLVQGTCVKNDTNEIVKVTPDRACSQWLACETGETVYDPQVGQFKSICSDLALCNDSGALGGEGVPFCTSFVDRSAESTETVLKAFTALDASAYASRPIGFGAQDYSGFSIPDQYLIVDAELEPIGSLLTVDPRTQSKYKKDYRLGVPVPIGPLARALAATEAIQIIRNTRLQSYGCQLTQTGAYGLMTDDSNTLSAAGTKCWVSMDQGKPPEIVGGAALVADHLNVSVLSSRFDQAELVQLDQTLSRSFPNTQCKAAPEANSPFGNEFVTSWDNTTDPPLPDRVSPGYANATFCEYGEECSCVYKRVKYGSRVKFYESQSTDVVNAICIGGPRDSLPCVPDSGIEGSQTTVVVNATISTGDEAEGEESESTQEDPEEVFDEAALTDRCGEGGQCTPISETTLVRGVTGQCLQYDLSRNIAGDQTRNECLVWNPNPVLAGPGDQYHWQPTAGFAPPQSSGRYYCTAPVREPRTEAFTPAAVWPKKLPREGVSAGGLVLGTLSFVSGVGFTTWATLSTVLDKKGVSESCGEKDKARCVADFGPMTNSAGTYMGSIRSLFYADWFTSDGSCSNALMLHGCTGNEGGASLDGKRAKGTKMGERCENIDDEKGQAFQKNSSLMRLVTTGQGSNRSYAEYALLFNPTAIAYTALGFAPEDWDTAFEFSLEDNIANFEFGVSKRKIGCAYSEEWGNVKVENYNKKAHKNKSKGWEEEDNKWHANFLSALSAGGGNLNRTTAQIVTEDGSASGIPVKSTCVVNSSDEAINDNRGGEEGLCYMKTWELLYNADGQIRHQAFSPDIGRNGLDHLSRRPVYGKCDSSKHWFSIRAVFEDTNPVENALDPVETAPDQLVGPFQFVGLWITACAPGDETKFIYMSMKMNSADVCRELAETVSKDSNESVAFTDRNQQNGGYSMRNGFNWYTGNIPFGASLATGDADTQPLFMTGVPQTNVNPLNPPTFTSPGVTYFSSAKYPVSNWGLLSNVFAKIYRIYGYYPRAVSRDDWACTNKLSPQFGQWCPPLDALPDRATAAAEGVDPLYTQEEISKDFCGFQGKCLKGGIDGSNLFSQKVCNSFSGINRGLDCSADPDICHVAPMQEINGVLTPQFASCVLFAGYYPSAAEVTAGKQQVDMRWEEMTSGRYRCTTSDGGYCDIDGCGTETGCSRAEAVKNGAFRCSGSVRDPDDVEEKIQNKFGIFFPTYASYCTRESDNSSECPMEISSGTCTKDTSFDEILSAYLADFNNTTIRMSGKTTCVRNKALIPAGATNVQYTMSDWYMEEDVYQYCFTYEQGSNIGYCEGYPWAQCIQDTDCHFKARNFWPSGDTNVFFNWALGSRWLDEYTSLGQIDPQFEAGLHKSYYQSEGGPFDRGFFYSFGLTNKGLELPKNKEAAIQAFAPAMAYATCLNDDASLAICPNDSFAVNAGELTPFFLTPAKTLENTEIRSILYEDWDDTHLTKVYPGFNPLIFFGDSRADFESFTVTRGDRKKLVRIESIDSPPFIKMTKDQEPGNGTLAHYGACESVALMFQDKGESNMDSGPITGTCRGGGRDGEVCSEDTDCRPPGMTDQNFSTFQGQAETWCKPVTTGKTSSDPGEWYGPHAFSSACWIDAADGTNYTDAKHPRNERDPSLDTNICTHPAGYWPRPQFCRDPNDEFCGLFGYNLTQPNLSVNDNEPLPTDVTPGLYTPVFLNPDGESVGGTNISYNYTDYYNPIPPLVAGPDIRTCQGGQCRITGLGTFTIDGIAEGIVNAGTGDHVSTIRFYAWAAHNQMPLRRVLVDWGDGTVTEVPDAHMKNRKPYCGTNKECSETSGLTCSTDADCPPGGGLCVDMGNCTNDPNKTCFRDEECEFGLDAGICEPRVYFGNDTNACEEQYFEFRHAYSCMPEDVGGVTCPMVGTTLEKHCSRDPNRACTNDQGCAIGDTCLANVVQPSGCFDTTTQSCRFTPRIMVVDNWGWCSGECRAARNANNQSLIDVAGAAIRHPNGGCFDASKIKSNYDTSIPIGVNECDAKNPGAGTATSLRPWVVFPGSIQLMPGQDL